MPPESPFREEDLQARVEALRLERDNLARSLAVMRAEAAGYGRWSWWRFLLGLSVLPLAAILFLAAEIFLH